MNWEIKITSKTLMIKISHISWGGYYKGFYDININNPQLKDKLKLPLQEGWAVIIERIENGIDSMLYLILEKQVILKGRTKVIRVSDT